MADEIPVWPKDPDAVLDWHIDWIDWLSTGETISTSTFIVSAGLTKSSDTSTASNTTVWLSGGERGRTYRVVNRIVTTQGRTDDRSFNVRISDR